MICFKSTNHLSIFFKHLLARITCCLSQLASLYMQLDVVSSTYLEMGIIPYAASVSQDQPPYMHSLVRRNAVCQSYRETFWVRVADRVAPYKATKWPSAYGINPIFE